MYVMGITPNTLLKNAAASIRTKLSHPGDESRMSFHNFRTNKIYTTRCKNPRPQFGTGFCEFDSIAPLDTVKDFQISKMDGTFLTA
jgi:hypothetical protein